MSDYIAPRSLLTPAGILTRQECDEIAKRVLSNSPAPEMRVSITSAARADTRFAVNQVTTSGENHDTTVTITAYTDDGRAASVVTNRRDEASLAAAAKQAFEIAKLVPVNPERMPELGPQQYPQIPERAVALPTPEVRGRPPRRR